MDDKNGEITVNEYMSHFKYVILPEFVIEQIKELITYYRMHADVNDVIDYNLSNIENILNNAKNFKNK